MKVIYLIIVIILLNLTVVNGHVLFNSDTRVVGDYKIQIATDPEIPSEGENTKIMLAVTSSNDQDLYEVILSLRLLQGEKEVLKFGPTLVKNGHLNIEHKFDKPGQYIAIVNIYENNKVIEATFNLGVTRTLSMIFITLIIISIFAPIGLVLGIRLFKKK